MGLGSSLKKAVKKVANVTIKAPIKLIKQAPATVKQIVKNPLDFKSAAGIALLNTNLAPITHPKEHAILGGVGYAGAYLTGATAAAGSGGAAGAGTAAQAGAVAGAGTTAPAGTYLAGAGAAAGTAAPAAAVVGPGTYMAGAGAAALTKATDFVMDTAIMNQQAKGAQKLAAGNNQAEPGAPGVLAGVSTGTLITAGVSILSLVTLLATRN